MQRTTVNDNTADGSSVAADPLRRAVYDDVRTVLDGSDEVTWGAYSQLHISERADFDVPPMPKVLSTISGIPWSCATYCICQDLTMILNSSLQLYLGELRERGDVVLGVTNALDVDCLRVLVDRRGESLEIGRAHV